MVEPQKMPELPVSQRIKSFEEVALGYTKEQAIAEAKRCIQCKKPACIEGCPVEIDIPGFIKAIAEGNFDSAIKILKEKNSLPGICGRVCPQEDQCQKLCVLGKKDEPVSIGALERFVADWELASPLSSASQNSFPSPSKTERGTGVRIAVVGSGPAGLTCAGDLAKLGFSVTLFESLHIPGGVLTYGIPEFRLPKRIVQTEVDYIKSLGVDIQTNMLIGKIFTTQELLQDFKAVFIGTGAGLPRFLKIPGENLCEVYSANEFLTRVNLMKAYLFPEYLTPAKIGNRVAVVGGGNVAMDSARVALRLGAKEVNLVYRRSRREMPARIEEVKRAEEEGINFHLLTLPVKLLGDEKNFVKEMECLKMKLGEPDASGRARPIPIPGSEFKIRADTVIIAIGQSPNPLISRYTKELKTTSWGGIIIDEKTQETSIPCVYAGGDIVTGADTVISAMGAGKRAAKAISSVV